MKPETRNSELGIRSFEFKIYELVVGTSRGLSVPQKKKKKKIRGTSEKNKCLFEKSRFFDFELFRECFNTPEFEKVDLVYYYNVVKDWSASKGRMQKDWIAQTRNIIRADYRRGQIKYTSDSGEEKSVILGNSGLSYGDLLGVLNEDFE